jgi:hypothetical protein
MPSVDLREIRRHIVVAIASDEELFQLLVLKGGNALDLFYLAGERGSLDLDYSISEDLDDVAACGRRLLSVLRQHFTSLGITLFDESFNVRPRDSVARRWGGYEARFKLIAVDRAATLGGDHERLRRESLVNGPGQQRVFLVQISKHEYCDPATVAEIDGAVVRIYTPLMLISEKLRAICQQMREYAPRRHPAPRARDFFDISRLLDLVGERFSPTSLGVVLLPIFAAKEVVPSLLLRVREYRAFHEQEWVSVIPAVRGQVEDFEFYFRRVEQLIDQLHGAGVV